MLGKHAHATVSTGLFPISLENLWGRDRWNMPNRWADSRMELSLEHLDRKDSMENVQ
jgi:hypothetical protein